MDGWYLECILGAKWGSAPKGQSAFWELSLAPHVEAETRMADNGEKNSWPANSSFQQNTADRPEDAYARGKEKRKIWLGNVHPAEFIAACHQLDFLSSPPPL